MVLTHRQVVFGLGVLVVGICCALPFQKIRPQLAVSDTSGEVAAADEFVWLEDGISLQVAGQQDQASPALSLYDQSRGQEVPGRLVPPPRIRKHASLENSVPSPIVPGQSNLPLRPDETLPFDSSTEVESGEPKQAISPPQSDPRWQWYQVRPGDSLATIAERFLGDAGQVNQIRELNRDRVSEIELLPVGLQLRVPRLAP
ncbi:MAG: LysM domain-containing protein [Planctomycetota bacterium]|nr:LysM domain-containing protein [Planctomycetota bacterium]